MAKEISTSKKMMTMIMPIVFFGFSSKMLFVVNVNPHNLRETILARHPNIIHSIAPTMLIYRSRKKMAVTT